MGNEPRQPTFPTQPNIDKSWSSKRWKLFALANSEWSPWKIYYIVSDIITFLLYSSTELWWTLEARKSGEKYKLNRDFMKDGHFSSQRKGSMLNVDAREFYNDLFFCNEKDGGSITTTAGTSNIRVHVQ